MILWLREELREKSEDELQLKKFIYSEEMEQRGC
jgi:hypothetical protein